MCKEELRIGDVTYELSTLAEAIHETAPQLKRARLDVALDTSLEIIEKMLLKFEADLEERGELDPGRSAELDKFRNSVNVLKEYLEQLRARKKRETKKKEVIKHLSYLREQQERFKELAEGINSSTQTHGNGY